MIVNAYVIWSENSDNAWIFDTGTDALPIFAFIEEKKLKVDAIFLTHTHRDHVACLDDLRVRPGIQKFLFTNSSNLMDAIQLKKVLSILLIHFLLKPSLLMGIL